MSNMMETEKEEVASISCPENGDSNMITNIANCDDDDMDSIEETDVQLGFVDSNTTNDLFKDRDWRNWDGGKIGGRPVSSYV
jgi:hypothetical protein